MKTLLLLLSISLPLAANTITIIPEPPAPGDYLLEEQTVQAIFESGPEPFCCGLFSWEGSGIIAVLDQYVRDGAIAHWQFDPCPAVGGCDLTEITFTAGDGVTGPPGDVSTPEPGSLEMVLGGAGLMLLGFRRVIT